MTISFFPFLLLTACLTWGVARSTTSAISAVSQASNSGSLTVTGEDQAVSRCTVTLVWTLAWSLMSILVLLLAWNLFSILVRLPVWNPVWPLVRNLVRLLVRLLVWNLAWLLARLLVWNLTSTLAPSLATMWDLAVITTARKSSSRIAPMSACVPVKVRLVDLFCVSWKVSSLKLPVDFFCLVFPQIWFCRYVALTWWNPGSVRIVRSITPAVSVVITSLSVEDSVSRCGLSCPGRSIQNVTNCTWSWDLVG